MKHRKLIAMDETIIKTNGKKCYVYVAYDLSNNELLCMKGSCNTEYCNNSCLCEEGFENFF